MSQRLNRLYRLLADQSRLAQHFDEVLDDSEAPKLVMAKAHETTRTVPTSFESPESSTIAGASFERTTGILTVEFKRGSRERTPKRYVYENFPSLKWLDFLEADSKGAFFAKEIRPFFVGRVAA